MVEGGNEANFLDTIKKNVKKESQSKLRQEAEKYL